MSEPQTNTTLFELSSVFTLEKRLERDFEILDIIGKGGFATVLRARNRLDNTEYAIKKIVLDMKGKSVSKIKQEIETVLNEIRYMAKIKNDFVVRYNHSWIEVQLKDNVRGEESLGGDTEELCLTSPMGQPQEKKKKVVQQGVGKNGKCDEEDESFDLCYYEDCQVSSNLGIKFESHRKCVNLEVEYEDCSANTENSILGIASENRKVQQIKEEKIMINKEYYKLCDLSKLVVYIQMELCKQTLSEFLSEQNENEKENINFNAHQCQFKIYQTNLEIFKSVIKSIEYLHDTEKLIHRDIKPSNIFITENYGIKVGDFGLATELYNMKYLNKNQENSRKNSEVSNSTTFTDSNAMCANFHTKNVGTIQYASPEQLKENYYDQKSDIFSLGLVLFEMITPMMTGMEKHEKFAQLKTEGKVPQALVDQHPNIANMITEMVDRNPVKRPSANEVLIRVNKELIDIQRQESTNSRKKLDAKGKSQASMSSDLVKAVISFGDNEQVKVMYVKVMNDKLLLYTGANSSKASFAYALNECEVSIQRRKEKKEEKEEEEVIEIDHPFLTKITLQMSPMDEQRSVSEAILKTIKLSI